MKRLMLFSMVCTALAIAACAKPAPNVNLTPGAQKIQFGVQDPPRHTCQFVNSLVAQYSVGVLAKPIKVDVMRHRATNILRNQAYAQGANFVYVKREDAEIQGAYQYQTATSITIYGDAFVCKNFKFLNNQ